MPRIKKFESVKSGKTNTPFPYTPQVQSNRGQEDYIEPQMTSARKVDRTTSKAGIEGRVKVLQQKNTLNLPKESNNDLQAVMEATPDKSPKSEYLMKQNTFQHE